MTENQDVLGCYVNISRRLGLEPVVKQLSDDSVRYVAETVDTIKIIQLLSDLNLIHPATGLIHYRIDQGVIKKECCRRAFVKGAFLGGGTVIDPRKNYNLEIVTSHFRLSQDLHALLQQVGFPFKSVVRKSKYVLYIKNSEQISDVLTYMGAFKAQMELLNVKIEKEIRNDFNGLQTARRRIWKRRSTLQSNRSKRLKRSRNILAWTTCRMTCARSPCCGWRIRI